jgi:hypothetical protein
MATGIWHGRHVGPGRGLLQEFSIPRLAKIRTGLDGNQKRVLPRSSMAPAIQCALNQWRALHRYTEHGFLTIDHSAADAPSSGSPLAGIIGLWRA